jgi:CRISPR/Cas system CSM-associated protein Csm5 (group 7 of RAMP superfamily)
MDRGNNHPFNDYYYLDRMYEIDRENKILYEKLLNIHSKQAKKVDISGQGNLLHLYPLFSFQGICQESHSNAVE